MSNSRPYVLSIAGFDPSGGAGVLADIKTFENKKVYGLGVCTAITFQNDKAFDSLTWISLQDILKQIQVLSERFTFHWVKIGLVENLEVLEGIIHFLKNINPDCKIIWDPILKASAGFVFHKALDEERLLNVCRKIYLITPNLEEIKILFPELEVKEAAAYLNAWCNVLLKGGHGNNTYANDTLFIKNKQHVFESRKSENEKHGTGCVLSSAILSELAFGNDLESSCRSGKNYVTEFINSHSGLLGYHYV
jgi:hydroxymethylpyrimidine/phosphomethylpyrimidine kinase